MKRKLTFGIVLLLIALILAVIPVNGEEEIYEDVIRLHILAESDSEEDQRNKLSVRDALLAEYGTVLSGYATRDAAAEAARELLPAIEKTARETLFALGAENTVSVTLTEEAYPRRSYGAFALPAGTYLSLRVMIGAAEGRNWWCVLYPPLCLETSLRGDASLSQAEWGLMTDKGEGRYQAKFKILELLESVFE